MSECVAVEARKASTELASAEKSVIDAISKKGEPAQYKKTMQVAFESSKKTYQKFRVYQCEFEASQAAGGNATHDLQAACETELDLNRAKELQAWVARGQN